MTPSIRHTFLVERYAADLSVEDVIGAGRRTEEAAPALSPGTRVRYLGSILLPADEMSLCFFQGTSEDVLRRALEDSPLSFERITDALPVSRRTHATRPIP